MWIECPLEREADGREKKLNRMFDTHPPIADRIAALKEM
jgi:Zn-dependent protease with chaperone function